MLVIVEMIPDFEKKANRSTDAKLPIKIRGNIDSKVWRKMTANRVR